MPTYNGHKNWNHWNVSLWICNDEGLYRLAMKCISAERNKDHAARLMLSYLDQTTPDGAPYTFSSIRAALRGL